MKKTNENGITLIALVVTIVVLLILAGITITYVLANNGVFTEAKNAAMETTAASIQDYASQMQGTVMMDYYTHEYIGKEGGVQTTNGGGDWKTWASGFFPTGENAEFTVKSATFTTVKDGVIKDANVVVTSTKHPGVDFTVTFKDGTATVTHADAAAA